MPAVSREGAVHFFDFSAKRFYPLYSVTLLPYYKSKVHIILEVGNIEKCKKAGGSFIVVNNVPGHIQRVRRQR